MLTVVVVLAVLAAAYFAYQAYGFYRERVAPIVENVSKAAAGLNPYTVTKDATEIAQWLQASFRMPVPAGYVGAFGIRIQWLGRKHLQLMALIPADANPSDIFEGGRNEVRFSPGKSTIFIAAQFNHSEREEMEDAISGMVQGGHEVAPFKEVFIDAGGRKVAALRGETENYGAVNTAVYVFLDDGLLFYATGPKDSFDEKALNAALTELVTTHPANELLYKHPPAAAPVAKQPDPCGIPGLSGDYEVVVVSVYRGSTALDVAIDQSGHDVTQEEVVVGVTPKPVVLVLMGYDPIVWRVGQTAGARIAGILAEGYYRQAVIGVPTSTRLSSYSTSDGPNACPHFTNDSGDTRESAAVSRRIKELFGRRIDVFLNKKAGGRFVVGEVTGEVTYAPDVTLQNIALPGDVLPGGQRGLDRLEKAKAIRLATDEEITSWLKGAARRLRQPLDKYRSAMSWRLGNGEVYVVLKEFNLPEGLGGANARTFIIPPGATRPGGPQGHCTFLQMEGFQCYGVGCR